MKKKDFVAGSGFEPESAAYETVQLPITCTPRYPGLCYEAGFLFLNQKEELLLVTPANRLPSR
jgi:hypothetical protein